MALATKRPYVEVRVWTHNENGDLAYMRLRGRILNADMSTYLPRDLVDALTYRGPRRTFTIEGESEAWKMHRGKPAE